MMPMRPTLVFLVLLTSLGWTHSAFAGHALGVRAGGFDAAYIGAEWQIPARIGTAILSPSLDASFGDLDATLLNLDLRWDLLPLFDTGILFYGKAGPTMLFSDQNNDVGLSLTAAADIGLRRARSLHIEWRFGFGDIPDRKLGLTLMFGL
jgi:hypothetical protein